MPIGRDIVDSKATPETRQLLDRLHAANEQGVSLIGMDSSTKFGEFMRVRPGGPKDWSKTLPGNQTDIGDVCGRAPSIYGIDVADIVGDWYGLGQATRERARLQAEARALTGRHIRTIHRNGGVITLHYHMHNPIDDSPYNKGPAEIWQLLPLPPRWSNNDISLAQFPSNAGQAFEKFRQKLDSLIDFCQEMVDDEGKLIPMIFRPFHENNGNWFWWGVPNGSNFDTYIAAFRRIYAWMVWYIHEYRNHHALLWTTGPNGGVGGKRLLTSADYWRTLPDPALVDILGYDRYDDYGTKDQTVLSEVRFLVQEAERLGKVAAITEAGISYKGDRTLWPQNIWTQHVIGPVKNDPVATRVAWILLWHNFPNDSDGGRYFGPHKNHPNAADFRRIAERSDILLGRDFHSLTPSSDNKENNPI